MGLISSNLAQELKKPEKARVCRSKPILTQEVGLSIRLDALSTKLQMTKQIELG